MKVLQGIRWYYINYRKKSIQSSSQSMGKKSCLRLHYNGANCYLFVNGVEIHKFTTKDTQFNAIPLCVENTSKDFPVDNMKNTGLNGHVHDYGLDNKAIAVEDILDIYKYLMKKDDVK